MFLLGTGYTYNNYGKTVDEAMKEAGAVKQADGSYEWSKNIDENKRKRGKENPIMKLARRIQRRIRMSNCGCEGSCPACRIGEVDDHTCNHCKTEFCQKCHGVAHGKKSPNVNPCACDSE